MNDRIYKGRTLTTVDDWLNNASRELAKAHIPSPRLDAELLLGYMLGVSRTWLVAHGDDSLHQAALHHKGSTRRGSLIEHGDDLLLKRLKRTPIAYITGHKEFYGREFVVTPDTLIPRPETESLIDLAKKYSSQQSILLQGQTLQTLRVLDVGAGSGCLGLTLALELPGAKLTACDISESALSVAKKNAKLLSVKNAKFVTSDLLDSFIPSTSDVPSSKFHLIAANLPYVDRSWTDTSPEIAHEPGIALYADDGGLTLIKQLIDQAPQLLTPRGYLLLEADPTQHDAIIKHAAAYTLIEHEDYGVLLQLN